MTVVERKLPRKDTSLFLTSDFHFDSPAFNKTLFHSQFKEAKQREARILINGDVFDAITVRDLKRYRRGKEADEYAYEDKVDVVVDGAFDLLKPYVNEIDLLGQGNHEDAILRYCHTDLTKRLVKELNRVRDRARPPIVMGGYSGWFQYRFADYSKDGKSLGGVRRFIIYRNHGQGQSAEVTYGVIDLQRYAVSKNAHVIWLAHKHHGLHVPLAPLETVSSRGLFRMMKRRGIITGCYLHPYMIDKLEKDGTIKGYAPDWREVQLRTPQTGDGGAFINIEFTPSRADLKFTVTM